jgi:hypothetical protein
MAAGFLMTEEQVMTKCKGDDPAFPFVVPFGHVGWHSGLTKREYFAAKALQGLLTTVFKSDMPWRAMPAEAVRMAEQLIAELNRKEGE